MWLECGCGWSMSLENTEAAAKKIIDLSNSHTAGHDRKELVLHPSHIWGQRPVYKRDKEWASRFVRHVIPCCLNCMVDGYEDEPDAFVQCRRHKEPEVEE